MYRCLLYITIALVIGLQLTQGEIQAINGEIHPPADGIMIGCRPSESDKEVKWYKNDVLVVEDDRHIIEKYPENSTLEIRYPGKEDIGVYVCKEDDGHQVNVTLRSGPYVYYKKSINLNRGNTLNLECRGYGDPHPTARWFREDQELFEDGKRIKFLNTTSVSNGRLVIENLEITDYSDYKCMAFNYIGSYNSTTLVRVKNPLRVFWPIFGIVLQLGILAIIIFIHERRKKKAGLTKSD